MLMGEFHHNIDNKGRIIIPSKLREDLGEEVIVTRGLEKCLFIYSKDEWKKIVMKLQTLPFTKKDARNFMRFFLSGATTCTYDKQGRINIPNTLIEYASLLKDVVVIGVGDRLEVWDKACFENFLIADSDMLSDIAEHLFEQNLGE